VANDEELRITVAATQPEDKQPDEEAQTFVDASKDQERRAW